MTEHSNLRNEHTAKWELDTQLTHLGRESGIATNSVNPPIVRGSTTVFQTLAEFKDSYKGVVFESPRYGRSGTSTNFELQSAMAEISRTETCIATSSGLSAVCAVVGAHAKVGGHILVQESVYGPTQVLLEKVLEPLQCQIEFFDSAEVLAHKVRSETTLIFTEVPSSLTMRMVDIEAISTVARTHGIPLACDATWGTPVFFDAHGLGVDIAIHAATKYINGHSDVMLGLVTGTYAALQSTRAWCDRTGNHVPADSCWLALRGLRTLGLRMQRHHESAQFVANWLLEQKEVKSVLFPALPTDPGHNLWKKQFTGAPGPFTIELASCEEVAYENFINSLELFGLGTSWGGYESLVMPAIPHHLRALAVQPNEGRLVRFHIGLEDPRDLCKDIRKALDHIA